MCPVIETPNDPFRRYLHGPLGSRLFEVLADAAKHKRHIYAALYELDDEQLEAALETLGQRAHVVLTNGSVKKHGKDQNSDARERLRDTIDLHDRFISPGALGHNKFLVICDSRKKPRWVWTRSQNWTKTGLCTQANNSVLNTCIFVGRSLKTRVQGFRVVHVHDQNRVLAFHRWVEGQGHDVMVVAHLAPFRRFGYRIGFPSGGDWRESFNSDVYENW